MANTGARKKLQDLLDIFGDAGGKPPSAENIRALVASINQRSINPISQASNPNYQVTGDDYLLECDASAGAFSPRLPDAKMVPGQEFIFKRTSSSGGNVVITCAGNSNGQTIDGASTLTLSSQWAKATVMSDGVNYVQTA